MSYYHKSRGLGSVVSQPNQRLMRIPRRLPTLGSLGDDAPPTTLSEPTVGTVGTDPNTVQWQANVLAQLQAGVVTMQHAELQKWLQIAATVLIPVSAAVWNMIFKSGKDAASGI